jgi:hypothetical protein
MATRDEVDVKLRDLLIRERASVRQLMLPDATCESLVSFLSASYCVTTATPCAAFVIIVATACGWDT